MDLAAEIKKIIAGDVFADEATLKKYSRDASLFSVKPQIVVFPKNIDDIKSVVKFVNKNKTQYPGLSITARSAGTDMTGGPLNESIILDFTKYFNKLKKLEGEYAVVEPGMFYRDFEEETLKQGTIMPSYPASKSLCALGGMVANNAGGEKSLIYGKTIDYVEELKVILSDGEEYRLQDLSGPELKAKIQQSNFEGQLYNRVHALLDKNYDLIQKAKPNVSKNSSGYYLWEAGDRQSLNLAKLMIGAQGTLGIITEIKMRLVKTKQSSGMGVVFVKNLSQLSGLIQKVLPLKPSSFESFDYKTLKLAIRFFPRLLKSIGAKNLFSLGLSFLPDLWTILTFGMPKLVLLVEFEENSQEEVASKLSSLSEALKGAGVKLLLAKNKQQTNKYWTMRRESFNLLRQKVKDKSTAPFIDDVIVLPEKLPEFLPKLYEILNKYKLNYTIAGHMGNGNFHVIPLMNLEDDEELQKIPAAADEVYKLVLDFNGSISAEHNDGLIRSPYLLKMFGAEVYELFKQTKNIFDPNNIFNPGKKVGATMKYALEHIQPK
ncbi:MAG: FAD-binding oxidoreductase [bacterium]|nr:FAD-binding oxidoreductase [bacterium]